VRILRSLHIITPDDTTLDLAPAFRQQLRAALTSEYVERRARYSVQQR